MFSGILSSPSELEKLMDRCFTSPPSSSLSTNTPFLYPGYSGTTQLPQRPGFSAGSAEIGNYVQETTDFQAIFNVIDYLNSNDTNNNTNQGMRTNTNQGKKNKAMDEAVKYLKKKWKENSQDAIFILRTLIFLECCDKNCNSEWCKYVGTQDFMHFLMIFATINSSQNNRKSNQSGDNLYAEVNSVSKRLIKGWANNFQDNPSYPVFYDTYIRLKWRGVIFEDLQDGDETKKYHQGIESEDPRNSKSSTIQEKAEMDRQKLKKDLETVSEQIILCQEMLKNILLGTSTIATEMEKEKTEEDKEEATGFGEEEEEDVLIEIVAFLEACKTRMDDIIEVGMDDVNIITEPILELALEVNVELLATLEVERKRDKADLCKLLENKKQQKGDLKNHKSEKEDDLISLTYEKDKDPIFVDGEATNEKPKMDGLQSKSNEDLIDLHE